MTAYAIGRDHPGNVAPATRVRSMPVMRIPEVVQNRHSGRIPQKYGETTPKQGDQLPWTSGMMSLTCCSIGSCISLVKTNPWSTSH